MITFLTLLPFVGGLFILGLCRTRDSARLAAVLFAFASLVLTILLWFGFNPATPGMQFEVTHQWAASLGITYHVGVDGLGVLMLVLSALVVMISLAASWANEKQGPVYF
ncbi:MAG: NADH-quinone oxidoreductase subunit M, partial [Acidobacteriaceae bacterium]